MFITLFPLVFPSYWRSFYLLIPNLVLILASSQSALFTWGDFQLFSIHLRFTVSLLTVLLACFILMLKLSLCYGIEASILKICLQLEFKDSNSELFPLSIKGVVTLGQETNSFFCFQDYSSISSLQANLRKSE